MRLVQTTVGPASPRKRAAVTTTSTVRARPKHRRAFTADGLRGRPGPRGGISSARGEARRVAVRTLGSEAAAREKRDCDVVLASRLGNRHRVAFVAYLMVLFSIIGDL